MVIAIVKVPLVFYVNNSFLTQQYNEEMTPPCCLCIVTTVFVAY